MKTALVTGAGKRLGLAMAKALAADGYTVALHYNSSSATAEQAAEEICSQGGRAEIFGADLADLDQASRLVSKVAQCLGPIHFLVNSASFYDSDTLANLTIESWRALTDVNLAAPVMLMQSFAAQFNEGEQPAGASIVNMLDVQLSAPSPEFFSYFCAKAGLEAATKLGAFELAPNIRVNAIAPGLVLPSWGQTSEEFGARQALTPMKAGLGEADIIGAMRYLRDAPQVTGHIIPVDGGQRLMGFGNSALS